MNACTPFSDGAAVTRLRHGRSGFNSRQGLGCFLLATASSPALGPTQTPVQWLWVPPGSIKAGAWSWPHTFI